ncbi:EF hand domain-containing protein [Besnoitia besnoiti]|uniref:EF hand domain-containing protein n=1 Tax=Besnoitia besnoiti TaxID=94643 RepID=A0A2A9M8L1_BESBE|nr:EF hand domain-containing protein [Besnoitia besnoiti]PFH32246.1 EF hand domain-containing protein [Besnoitia besnoiti]
MPTRGAEAAEVRGRRGPREASAQKPVLAASLALSSSSLPPPRQQERRRDGGAGAEASERRRDIQRAFALFDGDRDGFLDRRELKAACRALGVNGDDLVIDRFLSTATSRASAQPASPSAASPVSSSASAASPLIDLDGFLHLCVGAWPQRSTSEELREIFRLFDVEKKGYVTAADVALAAQAVGSSLSSEDVDLMVREADRDGDGRLLFSDFERVFRRISGGGADGAARVQEIELDDEDDF